MADIDAVFILAQNYLDCVCDALNALSPCGCPDCHSVEVGVPAWDSCCGGKMGGQLWVAVESLYPWGNFPAPQVEPMGPCQPPLAATLSVGILRCALAMHDDGSAPSVAEKNALAQTVLQDAYIINNAISCCLSDGTIECCFRYLQGTQTFVGPEGGCVGSELRFTIEVLDPPCPVPAP